MRTPTFLSVAIGLLLAVCTGSTSVGAYTWRVPEDAPTIRAGVDSASAGDTVLVACGTYYECGINMKEDICLRSETGQADCVTIDGQGLHTIIEGIAIYTRSFIEGFTITGGHAWQGGGVYTFEADLAISNCAFVGNSADDGGGVYYNWGIGTISNCIFADNTAINGGGMFCYWASGPEITDCTFANNTGTGTGGLLCLTNSSPTLTNCTFYGNAAECGGVAAAWYSSPVLQNTIIAFSRAGQAVCCEEDNSSVTLTCCDIYGNAGGDWVGCIAGQYGISGNISEDPLFCDPENENFCLMDISPCAPFSPPNPECDLIGAWPVGCGQDIVEHAAFPSRLYLAPSSPNPFSQATGITYRIPGDLARSRVLLNVLDPTSRLIRTLVDARQQPGRHNVTWDGTDQVGRPVAGGVYFCRLSVGDKSATKRMLLIR